MTTEKAPAVPPFVRFCTASVPMVFDNSLSYYECLCALSKYLQDLANTVNFNAGQLDGLQAAFVELKEYVDNYFDNLDVQTEINNKLDEMAEGGQLADIIAQFLALAPVFSYGTVADMVAADNLAAGSIAKTAGYHSALGGGAATYYIREPEESETANTYNTIALDNGLIAQLISDGTINVDQYGAYGDGVHDDYAVIQFAISNNLHHTIYFSDKTYALSATLKTWINTPKKTSFMLAPTTKLVALNSVSALIEFGGLGGTIQTTSDRRKVFKGGILDATNCDAAIKIANTEGDVEIRECEIINVNHYGIYVPAPTEVNSSDLRVDGVIIYGIGGDYETYGIYCERPDNEFMNSAIRGCRYALWFGGEYNTGGQNIFNVNGLGFGSGLNPWIENSVFCRIVGDLNVITGCYCDTFKTFVNVRGRVTVTNCVYYSYMNNFDVALFTMSNQLSRLVLKNNQFTFPSTPATKHKGIVYPSEEWSAQPAMKNITISDNIIKADLDTINAGDILFSVDKPYMPFWNYGGGKFADNKWVKIGDILGSSIPYSLEIFITGGHFKADFMIERNASTNALETFHTENSTSTVNVELGFVYNNSDSGYPTYSVYLRQTSGTDMWLNPVITNHTNAKFMNITQNILDPVLETKTIADSIEI